MSTNPFEVSQLWAGRVTFFNTGRGFGKIRFNPGREEDAFFHRNQGRQFSFKNGAWLLDVNLGERRGPKENDELWFVMERCPKGPRAMYWGFQSEYMRLSREKRENEWKPVAKGLEDVDDRPREIEQIPVRNVRIKLYDNEPLANYALRINVSVVEVLKEAQEKDPRLTRNSNLSADQARWVAQRFGYFNFETPEQRARR